MKTHIRIHGEIPAQPILLLGVDLNTKSDRKQLRNLLATGAFPMPVVINDEHSRFAFLKRNDGQIYGVLKQPEGFEDLTFRDALMALTRR